MKRPITGQSVRHFISYIGVYLKCLWLIPIPLPRLTADRRLRDDTMLATRHKRPRMDSVDANTGALRHRVDPCRWT